MRRTVEEVCPREVMGHETGCGLMLFTAWHPCRELVAFLYCFSEAHGYASNICCWPVCKSTSLILKKSRKHVYWTKIHFLPHWACGKCTWCYPKKYVQLAICWCYSQHHQFGFKPLKQRCIALKSRCTLPVWRSKRKTSNPLFALAFRSCLRVMFHPRSPKSVQVDNQMWRQHHHSDPSASKTGCIPSAAGTGSASRSWTTKCGSQGGLWWAVLALLTWVTLVTPGPMSP